MVRDQLPSDQIVEQFNWRMQLLFGRASLLFRKTAAVCAVIATIPAANASEIKAETVDDLNVISISGDIELGDDKKFNRIALGYDEAVVVLESNGGNLSAALEIGKSIHLKGFSTYVFDGSTCASSCALIWIAGLKRFVSKSSHIGFHASYLEVDGRQEQTGVGNAIVGRYLTLLNLPEKAVIFATSASPDTALWLNTADQNQSGIDFVLLDSGSATETPTSAAPTTQAKASSKPFNWEGPDGWSVFENENRCTLAEVFSTEQKLANVSTLSVSYEFDQSPSILLFTNKKFSSLKDGEKYELSIDFTHGDKLDDSWHIVTAYSSAGNSSEIGNGFTIKIDRDQILSSFMSNDLIVFKYKGRVVDTFTLHGATEGVRQLKLCAARHLPVLSDPFRAISPNRN